MPDKNLSGEVTDIALHTITIRNWDNTISVSRPRISSRDLYQLAGDVLLRGAADHAQYRHRSETRCVFSTRRCSPRC
ncbi:hypothetical protein NQ122_27090 [Klebsiella pneumoniae]|nr:hypothetical protein [Klebsiella pneumoniae]